MSTARLPTDMRVEKFTSTPDYEWRDYRPEDQPNGSFLLPDGSEAPIGKPVGGWVSVPGGNPSWDEWCRGEQWGLDGLRYRHVYELNTLTIKHVQTDEQMLAFHREYGVEMRIGNSRYTKWGIRWRDLAERYDGIVIAPYFWSCRLGPLHSRDIRSDISDWYYGWDCASGCIWNPMVLTLVESGPTPAPEPERIPRPVNLEG